MKYTNISEKVPSLPGMYIVVYELTSDGKHYENVHVLRYFEGGKWSLEDEMDTSKIVAYAGPIEQYKEKKTMNEYMTFGEALEALNKGAFVARSGWNGKGMFLYKVEASDHSRDLLRDRCKDAVEFAIAHDDSLHPINEAIHINAHIDMKAADGSLVIGWLASQTDMQTDDWYIVKEA